MHGAWGLLWLWVCWFGLRCRGEAQERVRLGLGQTCGGWVVGQCDTNLTCVPTIIFGPEENTYPGVCSLANLPISCVPCSEVECPLKRQGCPAGHVTEPCGCCPQCARQRGQVCGGPHWGRGYCDQGLTCILLLGHARAIPPESGICKVLPGVQSNHMTDLLCPWMNVRKHRKRTGSMILVEVEEEVVPVCVVYGCEVQGDKCVCLERNCSSGTLPLSEDNCEDQLMRSRCNNVSCPAVPVPYCPPDSFLTIPYIPPRQCCPLLPALCTCAFERCPACPRGHHAHRVTRGNGHPGNCCHRYLCTPGEV
ncbi:hypothetical protein AAFF_G00004950 [Aldrovandia affinis]|uniref:IGFBP N-terminal domain-containing protein n=1 Tax=Aldrovandia affinis TaxID=143900 RepID=A0AAD7TDN4_9TELE|nr:hypothetical protein AAFF_G00004950 [Aldrovandia affinis]